MTNLISELADQILALINSKPRSPTKAEVEEVVRSTMEGGDQYLIAASSYLHFSNELKAFAADARRWTLIDAHQLEVERRWADALNRDSDPK